MIAIIIINYRKSDLTVRLCQTLTRVRRAKSELSVVIVDNGSDEGSRAVLEGAKATGLAIETLSEQTNWGYLGGARCGLKAIERWEVAPDWVIVSNSDIEFDEPHFLENLESLLDPEIGVVAPSILSGISHKNQNPYMVVRPRAQRMHFLKWVFRFKVTCFLYQMAGLLKSLAKRQLESPVAEPMTETTPGPGGERRDPARAIYAPHGSFMIFSRRYFERGGNLEHKPFLFGEEVTVAENCRRLGLKVWYEPSLVVSHADHGTMGWIPSDLMLRCQREASAFCADTYFPL